MPIPLFAVAAALAAGGTLVPHAAGGLIVTSAAGYVAGTYLSTTAVASIFAGAALTTGGAIAAGVAAVSGGVTALAGSAGVLGTSVGATGVHGALISAGVASSTPILLPAVSAGVIAASGFAIYRWNRLKKKVNSVAPGQEAAFTESEAKMIETVIKRLPAPKAPS